LRPFAKPNYAFEQHYANGARPLLYVRFAWVELTKLLTKINIQMITIDLNRIREALPNRAKVSLGKTEKGTPYIECVVRPSLYEKGTKDEESDIEQVFNWQREIIGKDNIMEFYTEETGSHWYIYLNRKPMEFVNVENEDINSFTNMKLIENGALAKQTDV